MPVLPNPRHEAFAQAIVKGLASERPNGKNTAKAAYKAVGYSPTTEHAAEAAAHRLLRNVEPVVLRIQELQAQALARLNPKLDVSRERVAAIRLGLPHCRRRKKARVHRIIRNGTS